jgi:hypothetical protein
MGLVDVSDAPVGIAPTARPISPLALVRDVSGTPQPPSEIVTRLQQWEPALGLKYHNVQWAFTWTWKADDPRRERIKLGEYPAESAFDIIGFIPLDCPVDAIPAYAVKALRNYPREEVRKLTDGVGRYNAVDVAKQQVETVLNDTLGGDALNDSVSATPGRVSVATDITPTKKKAKR